MNLGYRQPNSTAVVLDDGDIVSHDDLIEYSIYRTPKFNKFGVFDRDQLLTYRKEAVPNHKNRNDKNVKKICCWFFAVLCLAILFR